MLIIGIICLVMAAISYLRCLSIKNNNAKKDNTKTNEAKWQRSLAIIFLIFGILLVFYSIYLRRF